MSSRSVTSICSSRVLDCIHLDAPVGDVGIGRRGACSLQRSHDDVAVRMNAAIHEAAEIATHPIGSDGCRSIIVVALMAGVGLDLISKVARPPEVAAVTRT